MDNLTKLDYTLSVMKRQREKLWKDCLKNDYDEKWQQVMFL